MNPYVLIAAAVLALGAYAFGRHDGKQIEIAGQAKADQIAKLAGDAMTTAAVEAIKSNKPVFTTINRAVEKEFHSDTRYTSPDCSVTPAVWLQLEQAYRAAGGEPFSRGAVLPAPGPTTGSDPGSTGQGTGGVVQKPR